MRNDLDSSTQVLTASLFGDNRIINPTRGVVILLRHHGVGEPLVMPYIQVGFGTIVGDVNLPMLERVHRAGVDIDVRIQLLKSDC